MCSIYFCYAAQYFGATIMMLATSTVVSVIIISLHHRGVYGIPPSGLVKKVVLVWLASIVGLQDRVKAYSKQPHDVNNIDMGIMVRELVREMKTEKVIK